MKQFAICLVVVVIEVFNVWRCSVGYTVYGLPQNVHVVPVNPVCI